MKTKKSSFEISQKMSITELSRRIANMLYEAKKDVEINQEIKIKILKNSNYVKFSFYVETNEPDFYSLPTDLKLSKKCPVNPSINKCDCWYCEDQDYKKTHNGKSMWNN
jgi:hypothetical protein